jgi:hypothetical protein
MNFVFNGAPNLFERNETFNDFKKSVSFFFIHNMRPDLKNILFSLPKPHFDVKKK